MNKNVKILISFAFVGIIIPFASSIFCKTVEIGDEISVAIITAISTIIVVVIETLPKIIKVKNDNNEGQINHIEVKMKGIEAGEKVIVGNYIKGKISSKLPSEKVENKKIEIENVNAEKEVVAGDYILKE